MAAAIPELPAEPFGWPDGGRVQPVVWRPSVDRQQLARRDLMAVEAVERGV